VDSGDFGTHDVSLKRIVPHFMVELYTRLQGFCSTGMFNTG